MPVERFLCADLRISLPKKNCWRDTAITGARGSGGQFGGIRVADSNMVSGDGMITVGEEKSGDVNMCRRQLTGMNH